MIGISIQTGHDLKEQSLESRERNIRAEIIRQLEMNFATLATSDRDTLEDDYGFDVLIRAQLANNLATRFPSVRAADLLKCATLGHLIDTILMSVPAG